MRINLIIEDLPVFSKVSRLAGVEVSKEVFDALELNRYSIDAAVDFLLADVSAR